MLPSMHCSLPLRINCSPPLLSLDLPRLFNPQSFLTAIKQTTARRNEWALDRTVLVTEVCACAPDCSRAAQPSACGSVLAGAYVSAWLAAA